MSTQPASAATGEKAPSRRAERQRDFGLAITILERRDPILARMIQAHVADLRSENAQRRTQLQAIRGELSRELER